MAWDPAFVLFFLWLGYTPNALADAYLGGGGGGGGSGSLQVDVYQTSCPMVEDIVFFGVAKAVASDPRMAASLLRLHFHDCFVNGCDASVLLDDTPTFVGEKTAAPNVNSLRGFDVIDRIKSDLEVACPGTVSCADILATAARDSVVLSDGPMWPVEMGRRDSMTASLAGTNSSIPGPASNLATLIGKFQNLGLSPKDMVALSGAHTIGMARCTTFSSRLTATSNADSPGADRAFLESLQQLCFVAGATNSTLAQLDLATPATFDNQYYMNLLSGEGLLASDQALLTGDAGGVRSQVELYAEDTSSFFEDFKASMINMGRLKPLTGNAGEIRKNCRVVN